MTKRQKLSTNLIETIEKRQWHNICSYLNEADLPDSTNTYALHEICSDSKSPIQTVIDIYNAYPQAAFIKNIYEYTPLSIAVETGFEDAVYFLTNACPKSSEICGAEGSSPIQTAIYRLKSNSIINSIISTNPNSAFIVDDDGDSAFDVFFRHWNVFMRIVVNDIVTCDKNLNYFIGHGNWKIRDIYEITCLFLRAANIYHKGNKYDHTCLLHSALREEACHLAFGKLLIQLHPEQVLQRDTDGILPIHIITASRDSSDERTFLCMDCFMYKSKLVSIEYVDGSSKYCCEDCFDWETEKMISIAFNIRPVYKVMEIVKELLAIAPQMVFIPDNKGNYPIHIAICNQQSHDVVSQLHRAFPEMGNIRDSKTKLLPFMLAAMGNWENEINQITIAYHLLREDPHSIFVI